MNKIYDIEETNNELRENDKEIKHNTKKKKRSILKRIFITICILIILGGGILGILLYGPYYGFREWLISTAMTTMTHQWIAYVFYSQDTIDNVMGNNKVEEIVEDTDKDAIIVGITEKKEYENEYERAVLEKENPDDKYKIINISGKDILDI